jgi:hypothetical protein
VMVEKEDVEPADRRSQILARAIVDQLAGTPMEDAVGALTMVLASIAIDMSEMERVPSDPGKMIDLIAEAAKQSVGEIAARRANRPVDDDHKRRKARKPVKKKSTSRVHRHRWPK